MWGLETDKMKDGHSPMQEQHWRTNPTQPPQKIALEQATGQKTCRVFSATGNTERVAEVIADTTGGESFELEPVDPYTDEDLNYNDDNSRVSREYADESLRNVELVADTVDDWKDVERVYIGYAVGWGDRGMVGKYFRGG